MQSHNLILTINGGSSSIKFSLYQDDDAIVQLLYGMVESIGSDNVKMAFTISDTSQKHTVDIKASNLEEAANFLIDWLEKQHDFHDVKAIGHRIVHGMEHTAPERITAGLLDELKAISAFDPEHLPGEIKMIEIFNERYPDKAQVACFDTSFHSSMPLVAKMLTVPRRYYEKGIHRYGFHGLSYAYLVEELYRTYGPGAKKAKIIIAHLGNGASLAAIKDGKSLDTSMGFTPTSGLPMGTRTGDMDPGFAWYLMKFENFDPKQFSHLINEESGLLGLSETSSDMRDLIQHATTDHRAAEAVEIFCYQTKKWIGSFAAVLDGVEILVFSGGIGEHSHEVRSKICSGLTFLGIELNEDKNRNNETVISSAESKVNVRVIKTNEEEMIVEMVRHVLNNTIKV